MNKIEFYSNLAKFQGRNGDAFLKHYGIIGQKWGTRRWQNPDGTFNAEGKERYFGSKKSESGNEEEQKIGGMSKYNYKTDTYHHTDYQNEDGTLTKKGEKLLKRWQKNPNGFFSNIDNTIDLDMYNKATGNNIVDKKKEAEKEAYDKFLNDLEEKDKSITVKHNLKNKEISQEEFDKAAKEIKDTFDDMDSWDDDYNEIADLGLYKMIKNGTLDNDCKPGDKWDRFWFMEEDQTPGYPEVTDLYRKGYSREYIKQFANKLGDMDYEEADEISSSLNEGSRYINNILNDIIGPEDQKIGSTNSKKINWEKIDKDNQDPKFDENKYWKNKEKAEKYLDKNYDILFAQTVKDDYDTTGEWGKVDERYKRYKENPYKFLKDNGRRYMWDYINAAVEKLGLKDTKNLSSSDWDKINAEINKLKK